MITINNTDSKIKGADEFESGDLFYDSDGDLYFRLNTGCLILTGRGEALDETQIGSYSEADLTDYETYDYLKDCTRVKGKVSVTIDLE